MTGVGSTARVDGPIHVVVGQENSPLASSPLTACKKALRDALGNTGFVDITGQSGENFRTYLNRRPFEIEVGDLKPGMLTDLRSWVTNVLSSVDPDQALQTQARVEPDRAVALLT